jgi:uncharacterized membrane protein YfcA
MISTTLLITFFEQPIPWLAISLGIFGAFTMGFARSGLGAGGFVVSPLLVLALGGSDGLAVTAVLMLPASFMGAWQHRKDSIASITKPMLPAAILGTVIGGLILWQLVTRGELSVVHYRIEIVVSVMSLIYIVLISFRNQIANIFNLKGTPSNTNLFGLGALVGMSQTVVNSGTPLMTVFFLCYRITKEKFVGAQLMVLLAQNLFKLLPFILLGILHFENATAAILLLPLTFIGSWLGNNFYKKATEKTFFGLYVVLLFIGFVASVLLLIGRENILS